MNNGMNIELFRVNGQLINRAKFYEKLQETLEEIHFADVDQIALYMKADKRYVKTLLLDYIIEYTKENPAISGNEIVNQLKVGYEYIEELIEEGRIVATFCGSVEELKQLQEKAREINNTLINQQNQRNDQQLIQGLGKSMQNNGPKLDLKPKGPTFHTTGLREKTGIYKK